MNQIDISKALALMLETNFSARYPIAFENIEFTPPVNGVYLEENTLPAETDNPFIQGTAKVLAGIYQVTVVCPLNTGSQAGGLIAAEVAGLFANDTPVPVSGSSTAYIDGHPSVFTGIVDGSSYRIPVSIPYSMFA